MSSRVIPVVAAVITRGHYNKKILLKCRSKEESESPETAGYLECPGGKVEYKEAPEQALKREILEELGCEVTVGNLLYAKSNTYSKEINYLVLFYDCSILPCLKPKDCNWFPLDSINDIQVLPGTREAVIILEESLKGGS